MPMWLIRAKCGGSKKICQCSLHSQRDVPFTLSGWGHFQRGCCFHPISHGQAAYVLATSLQWNLRCCYHMRWRKRGFRHTLHFPEFLWGNSEKEAPPLLILSPCQSTPLAPPLPLEEGTQTGGGLDIHPASTQTEVVLGCHSAGTQTEEELGCHPASTQTEGLGYHHSLKLL